MTDQAFHKYEGLGNDFVVMDVGSGGASAVAVDVTRARMLCDRRFGVGADGVLLLLPPSSSEAQVRMKVINADGSVPEMCGNGLRCAALHFARSHALSRGDVVFETDAGLRSVTVHCDDASRAAGLVTVDMGRIHVGERVELVPDGFAEPWSFVLADAGNPHAVTVRETTPDQMVRVGAWVSTHSRFAQGTNVEFARFSDGAVDLVVYERGVGMTLACGTGACATVAVGISLGHLRAGTDVRVALPGGSLAVRVDAETGRAMMRGPARHVFSGVIVV